MDFSRFHYISFDCYGTLIDWEAGILKTLSQPFADFQSVSKATVLQSFAQWESKIESGPFCSYFDVLTKVFSGLCREFNLRESNPHLLAESVVDWKPFDDSKESLSRLGKNFKLAILSNVDNAMFQQTQAKLTTSFHSVFTAQTIGSYKPAIENFHYLLQQLACAPTEILHVAQSLFHDHVPAKSLGITTVWVNRPSILQGQGATLPAQAKPDLTVQSMAELAELLCP
ncbi:MAG: haloacid dehalogenase type II [Planctomycetota bacterium]|nr:haloacid dehalogenase type II [Planctomycetota bacterium]